MERLSLHCCSVLIGWIESLLESIVHLGRCALLTQSATCCLSSVMWSTIRCPAKDGCLDFKAVFVFNARALTHAAWINDVTVRVKCGSLRLFRFVMHHQVAIAVIVPLVLLLLVNFRIPNRLWLRLRIPNWLRLIWVPNRLWLWVQNRWRLIRVPDRLWLRIPNRLRLIWVPNWLWLRLIWDPNWLRLNRVPDWLIRLRLAWIPIGYRWLVDQGIQVRLLNRDIGKPTWDHWKLSARDSSW